MDTIKPVIISIIRTVIMPLLAGGLIQLALLANWNPSLEARSALAAVLAVGWYLLARFLETKNRYWGLMLGVATTPNYEDSGVEKQLIDAVNRTAVPLLVGWVLTWLIGLGFEFPQDTAIVAVQGAITSGYYGLIRLIEGKRPAAGKLIGGVHQPTY